MTNRRRVTSGKFAPQSAGSLLISIIFLTAAFIPARAHASIIADFLSKITPLYHVEIGANMSNVQTMDLPKPALNLNPMSGKGGGDVTIVDDSALLPSEGPLGTLADIEKPKNGTISTYIVRPGDTLTGIAAMFDVTPGTILSANNIPTGGTLQVGQKLIILPITGISYTVKKGDTLASIAKAFNGDVDEIASYNQIDTATLAVGSTIIIPNGEVAAAPEKSSNPSLPKSTSHAKAGKGVVGPASIFANNPKEPAHNIGDIGTLAEVSYYIAPLSHYVRTQGIHGYNAVDLAAPKGTPIVAAAAGDVTVAREGGWNGGYGNYVVISHDNGSQTLYGHMSKVSVYDGEHVEQGTVIGFVGSTGESTGPHLHFEIRNGIRNPF